MSYIIPIGNGSFVSAKNGWFCVSCAVTCESLGYYSWIMVGYRVPGYLQQQQHQHAATAAVSLSGMPVSCPALTGGNVGGHDTPPFLRAFGARGTHDHNKLAVRLRATGKF